MTVKQTAIPAREALRVLTFPRLDGGLDLQELEYRVEAHRSPEMKNLWWQDGVLQCRDGQVLLWSPETEVRGWAACREPFQDRLFFHAGTCLYRADPSQRPLTPEVLATDVPENRGEFFPFGSHLYYKNRGGFYRMDGASSSAQKVEDTAFVPTVLTGADPSDPASGTPYQPANRLSPLRRVCYNAAPGVTRYLLPFSAQAVTEVRVDGRVLTAAEYAFGDGAVEFAAAPGVTDPPTENTVAIVCRCGDDEARQQLMDCCHAGVFGGGEQPCILLGGSRAAPNAVFWTGSGDPDPGYWPADSCVFVGDAWDAVTGFGSQYGHLLLLKARSLWRLDRENAVVGGLRRPVFAAELVSSRVGCDLPGTAALVENNLVFCSRDKGVYQVRGSSAAYETDLRCLSRRVHGSRHRGLLRDLRNAAAVTGFDDGSRYWLCLDGRVYLWDYGISTAQDPGWFYLEGISAVDFFRSGTGGLYHLDPRGRLTAFERVFADYGGPIEKCYRFPTQDFGTCDRRKHVESVLLNLRADTDSDVTLRYAADGGVRTDPTPIRCRTWRFVPRDLRRRCLRISPFAHTARRRPCLRRVRYFSMTLENATAGSDLAIVSAQVFYRLADRQK